MKNVKVNLSRKAGFSLVEMLVVIAIIGIIAAIAIPNIGSINESARNAAAQRNAQSVASVLNAAVAAGAELTLDASSDGAAVVAEAQKKNQPKDGPFKNKTFTVGDIDTDEVAKIAAHLSWDNENQQVIYKADITSGSGSSTPPPAGP